MEHNFKCAEGEAEERLSALRDRAGVALDQRYQTRLERVRRTYARRLFRATEETEEILLAERDAAVEALEEAWSKDRRYLLAVKARPLCWRCGSISRSTFSQWLMPALSLRRADCPKHQPRVRAARWSLGA